MTFKQGNINLAETNDLQKEKYKYVWKKKKGIMLYLYLM